MLITPEVRDYATPVVCKNNLTDFSNVSNPTLVVMWPNQSSSIEAQQSDQPVLQITLQEVIDSTTHEETIGDDVRREETIGDNVRHEETMGDDVRREETMTDEMQQWFDWVV